MFSPVTTHWIFFKFILFSISMSFFWFHKLWLFLLVYFIRVSTVVLLEWQLGAYPYYMNVILVSMIIILLNNKHIKLYSHSQRGVYILLWDYSYLLPFNQKNQNMVDFVWEFMSRNYEDTYHVIDAGSAEITLCLSVVILLFWVFLCHCVSSNI